MKTLKELYKDARPVAARTMCNFGGVVILEIAPDGEKLLAADNIGNGNENPRRYKINTTPSGRAYFTRYGRREYLDQYERL